MCMLHRAVVTYPRQASVYLRRTIKGRAVSYYAQRSLPRGNHHLARRTAGQNVENGGQPSPPYPGVAGKLHVGQGDTVWGPVCPNGLGSNAKDRPTGGQGDETGMNLGASRGELALADYFRRTLVAAVRTVQVGCDGDLGIHARPIGRNGDADLWDAPAVCTPSQRGTP